MPLIGNFLEINIPNSYLKMSYKSHTVISAAIVRSQKGRWWYWLHALNKLGIRYLCQYFGEFPWPWHAHDSLSRASIKQSFVWKNSQIMDQYEWQNEYKIDKLEYRKKINNIIVTCKYVTCFSIFQSLTYNIFQNQLFNG